MVLDPIVVVNKAEVKNFTYIITNCTADAVIKTFKKFRKYPEILYNSEHALLFTEKSLPYLILSAIMCDVRIFVETQEERGEHALISSVCSSHTPLFGFLNNPREAGIFAEAAQEISAVNKVSTAVIRLLLCNSCLIKVSKVYRAFMRSPEKQIDGKKRTIVRPPHRVRDAVEEALQSNNVEIIFQSKELRAVLRSEGSGAVDQITVSYNDEMLSLLKQRKSVPLRIKEDMSWRNRVECVSPIYRSVVEAMMLSKWNEVKVSFPTITSGPKVNLSLWKRITTQMPFGITGRKSRTSFNPRSAGSATQDIHKETDIICLSPNTPAFHFFDRNPSALSGMEESIVNAIWYTTVILDEHDIADVARRTEAFLQRGKVEEREVDRILWDILDAYDKCQTVGLFENAIKEALDERRLFWTRAVPDIIKHTAATAILGVLSHGAGEGPDMELEKADAKRVMALLAAMKKCSGDGGMGVIKEEHVRNLMINLRPRSVSFLLPYVAHHMDEQFVESFLKDQKCKGKGAETLRKFLLGGFMEATYDEGSADTMEKLIRGDFAVGKFGLFN